MQSVGKTTRLLHELGAGDDVLDVVGPLGQPSRIDLLGTVVAIGGGVGAAIVYPTAVALRAAGNRVVSILGARTRELVILEEELRRASDELIVTTDDGSYGGRAWSPSGWRSGSRPGAPSTWSSRSGRSR